MDLVLTSLLMGERDYDDSQNLLDRIHPALLLGVLGGGIVAHRRGWEVLVSSTHQFYPWLFPTLRG